MPRILITRSPHQASELAERLRALGVEPILIPTIALEDPTTFDPLDAAIAQLSNFHWLLFTSANAVEAFHHRLSGLALKGTGFSPSVTALEKKWALAPEVSLPPNCRIACIGPATARAVESFNRKPSLIPPHAVAESLAEALLPHVQPGVRFLLVRAESARDHLPETLRAAGADLTIVPVYRTIVPTESIAAIRQLFSSSENWPAAITFTSSSTVANLLVLLEVSGLNLPQEILRISIGPITSQTLRDLNLPPHAEAVEPSLPSLVAEVVKSLHLSNHP